MSNLERSLLTDVNGHRCYAVPAGVALPQGSFRVVGMDGSERCVDEAALAPFEILDEQLRCQVEAVVGLSRMVSRRAPSGKLDPLARRALEELARALQRVGAAEPPTASPEEIRAGYEAAALRAIEKSLADRHIQTRVSFRLPDRNRSK